MSYSHNNPTGKNYATFRPNGTNGTNGEFQDKFRREREAVQIIERAWCSYRDKQMFRLLKHSLCAAEHSLSRELLKRIVPSESHLLDDPIFKVKIKFRFAGEEFPPYIVFKIYTKTHNSQSSKYINGKNMITPSSTAAQEACSQMGNRKYFNMVIQDTLQERNDGKIACQDDVVSLRDYMQYSSILDNTPAYLGGRSNSWRRLNLEDLPKHTVFYDVMNYALNKKMSSHLLHQLPILLKPPVNSDIQMEQMRVLSKLDTRIGENLQSSTLNSSTYKSSSSRVSGRRSKKAITKVSRMRKAYTMTRSETITTEEVLNNSEPFSDSFKIPEELNDEFEDEVKNLYTWTKNLSMYDEFLNTPRVPPH